MANIKLPRKAFEEEIGKLDEKMQEKISLFGTPFEKCDENEIEIEVFPNRPDLLSYQGFKRSFLNFIGKTKGIKEYKIQKKEKDYKVIIDPSIKKIRPFTACAIIKNINLNEEKIKELIEIQEKIHNTIGRKRKKLAIGIYPLEKIKLPITYTALDPEKIRFMPLESQKEMSAIEILERHPTGKEYASLLAGKEKFPIFMDSQNNILSMPPIINSQLTGRVTPQTKELFVECSGNDFEILKKCLNIIVTTLIDMGGVAYEMELGYQKKEITPNLTPVKMKLSIQNTNNLLGLNLNEKEIKESLEKMGHNYLKGNVEIPSTRTDILHEVDIIEDIAIGYGYEKFIPEIPRISTIGKIDEKEIIKEKISEMLIGLNLLEVSNFHLTSKKDAYEKMGISDKEKQNKKIIEVKESKTDFNLLRENLSHYLLKNLSENIDSEYPQRIYEIGRVFEYLEGIKENEHLAVAFSPSNFTELKQTIEYLSKMINIKIEIKEPKDTPNHFIEGRAGEIRVDDYSVGHIGEIHPKILNNFKIKMPVALFEINLEKIYKKLSEDNNL